MPGYRSGGEDSEGGYSEETSGKNEKLPPELEDLAETHQYQQYLVEWYIYGSEGWKLSPDPEWIPDTYSVATEGYKDHYY